MVLTDKIHVSYALADEAKAKEVVESIYGRLKISYELYSISEQEDKDTYFDEVITPAIESADQVMFLYSREGANDTYLQQQFKLASNLNKPIIPIIIESSTLNLGILKVKSPFAFRTSSLKYEDEDDRIKITEQLHAALGLSKHGDVYGTNVSIISDRTVLVCRGKEIIGKAIKYQSFDIILSTGTHVLQFLSYNDDDLNWADILSNNSYYGDLDWVEYEYHIPDNDGNIETNLCIEKVEKVRKNRIADLMFDPTSPASLEWDTLNDTKIFRLSRSSQDIKKRDITIASFYRKYIEKLTPKPELKYTNIKFLPEKYLGYLFLLLTICIWGKALLWILAFALYLITFSNVNWAGNAWDWFWYDTSFKPLLWCVVIYIVYKFVCGIIRFVIEKKDEIRNTAAINRVTKENERLYNSLNDLQVSFLSSRGWKVQQLERYVHAYPESKLTFDYSTLPDNSGSYNENSRMELSFSSSEPVSNVSSKRQEKKSSGKTGFVIIVLLIIAAMVYCVKQCSSDEETSHYTETVLDNGNLLYSVEGVDFTMVKVNGGGYKMGSSSKQAWGYEKPVHNVVVSGFYIGQFEVTQQLWFAVMGANPSHNQESLQNPVENVSWDDCQIFIQKLNELTNQNFRLPTEAEWEYAARGGGKSLNSKYSGGSILEDVGWYKDNSDQKTHQVGLLRSNELGIYDMTGNVWEWVNDYHDYYPKQDQIDPTGPLSGDKKVHRGGSCENGLELSRLTIRAGGFPYNSHKTIGFRLAKPIIK